MTSPVALIAEDEPLLADALRAMLAQAWPDLQMLPIAPDGTSAIAAIARSQPDVVFLDISMPGATGIEVAQACARMNRPPQIVFVTAFDRFALEAFDAAAVDYLLKPVAPERLARTVARVRERLAAPTGDTLSKLLTTLRTHLDAGEGRPSASSESAPVGQVKQNGQNPREYLQFVRASVRDEIRIVPVEEICFFEAADKYVVVATVEGDLLIRTSLRELLPQLDPSRFWQVHRSTVVNVGEVVSAQHTPLGRLTLKLKRRKDRVAVSRQYAHLFRQM
ncbi:LytR/AlgR family response regulator transcription factor [Pandoraea sputorum]|uniref:LytR/AlgR family response regulator transcription factor n=1 Tax=Pandoraea sputorum TaxID=93222 RepID=UPI00123F32B2|nr:LytTR family DNA-binding domain-containing protein [Pandoraea sputorum]VVE74034.1 response regulator, lytTr family protein [Pandoraea sputorum]